MSLKKTEENLKVSFSSDSRCSYRFGPFLLDPNQRLLWRNGELVELEPKAIDTLLVLVRAEGGIVGKEELVAQVWEGDAITDSSLFHSIYVLRKALATSLEGKECIRNIPKRGYCFTVPVTRRQAEALPTKAPNGPTPTLAQIKPELVTDPIRAKTAVIQTKTTPASGGDRVLSRFRWWWGLGLGAAVLLLSSVLIAVRSSPAEPISGEWDGVYSVAEVTLRFVLHVSGDPGHFLATMDNPDQHEFGTPVTGLLQSRDEVTFDIASDSASFAGRLEQGGAALDGAVFQWGTKMPVHLIREPVSSAETNAKSASSARRGLRGTWTGILIIPQRHLRVYLHVNENKNGIEASLDCPDQAKYGTPVSTFTRRDREVRFAIPANGVRFQGRLEEHGSKIRGTLSQNGIDGELQLTRRGPFLRSKRNDFLTKLPIQSSA
jgi:DNA-binding winged helix-turn-helix (wHTH) protein